MPLFVDQLSDQTWESAKNAVEQMKQITDSIKVQCTYTVIIITNSVSVWLDEGSTKNVSEAL